MVNIAINGFGRIGRAILRIALERKMNVVAINDTHGAESAAYLFKYDSVYGPYRGTVEFKGNMLILNGKKIPVLAEREPDKLPWKSLKVDVVIESTGVFTDGHEAARHLTAGARKVIITAPAHNHDITIVPGVNQNLLKKEHRIVSIGSCTTNCTAPIVNSILNYLGIEYAMLTTIHAYTNDQVIQDSWHKSARRGRAGALNMVPTTTGAAEAVIEAIPALQGKMTGLSVRVPVPCGSLIDLTCEVSQSTTKEAVNLLFDKLSKGPLKGIIEYSTDPLVSSDIIGNSHSAVFDSLSTQVDGNLVKVLAWYDNEYGYSCRVADTIKMIA